MRYIVLTLSLLLVSTIVKGTTIESIKVFHTNDVHVLQDIAIDDGKRVEVFNMDTKDNATAKLNKLIQARHIHKQATADPLVSYSKSFDEVLNGPNWTGIYDDLERGSKAIEYAIRYKVKKTPAIIINDTSIIYGVTSMKEALHIYNVKSGK